MARLSEAWLQQLLNKIDIVDVVGEYVHLEKRGTRLWASCPWHHERNASFCVTPEKQMFYCFSCKKGGGVIQFIMEQEKLNFVEAATFLAERVGLPLPEEADDTDYQKRKEYRKRLHGLMRALALHYHQNLVSESGSTARQYIEHRGIMGQVRPYGLGFAIDQYDDAYQFLLKQGYTLQEMEDAGVVRHRNGRIYDFFRNRVMFPIQNTFGEVIGFGGRVLDDSEPKYLNSGETILFNKRYHLYALNLVRRKRGLKNIILTEGYMDTVALASAGIDNAVASLGTAFTREQARLLKRYTTDVYLCYDGDRAGINAALRAIDILEQEEIKVKVIALPDKMDPDDYIGKYGADAFRELGKEARIGIQYKLYILEQDYDMKVPDQVVEYATEAIKLVGNLENELEKERYINLLSNQTGLSKQSLQKQLEKGMQGEKRYSFKVNEINLSGQEMDEESKLITALIVHPELVSSKSLEEFTFADSLYQDIISYIKREIKKGIMPTCAEILSVFSNNHSKLAELLSTDMPAGASTNDYIEDLVRKVGISRLRQERDELLGKVQEAADEEREALMHRISNINLELHKMNNYFLEGEIY